MITCIGFDVHLLSIINFIVLCFLFTVMFLQMTSTEEITVIDVGEKECEEMPQNTEMSDNISAQQDISKVHTLNCLQTYTN